MPRFAITAAAIAALATTSTAAIAAEVAQGEPNRHGKADAAFPAQTRVDEVISGVSYTVDQIASGLQYPWAIAFLPDGRALVTEKPGRLRVITADGRVLPAVTGTPNVEYRGQGGLLDVAYVVTPVGSPPAPPRICLTYSEPREGGTTGTAARCSTIIARGENISLALHRTVWRQTPNYGGAGHFGSRIEVAPSGHLFITNGDRQDVPIRNTTQSIDNGIGKVARINPDGSTPTDNPFFDTATSARSKVWSLGHRNPQGATINPYTGKLWTVEHGAQGGDELNIPESGKNYGWPVITYGEDYGGNPIGAGITQQAGMEQPVYFWDPVIAPGDMVFYTGSLFPRWQGNLFIASLGRGQLVRLEIANDRVTGEERLNFGRRIRAVAQHPDGSLWMVTDEANGLVLRLRPN